MTIKDFAKKLGVSTATVSRAFSQKGRISENTRRMIMERAEEWGYCANAYARGLATHHSNTIGFFYPTIGNREPDFFINEIMLGVNETAARENWQLQIHPISDTRKDDVANFRTQMLNGTLGGAIIVAGTKLSKELVHIAKQAEIPYVVIGHMSDETERQVLFGIEFGTRQAGAYFSRTGRKRPAYVGGSLDKRKQAGFLEGLGELGGQVVFDKGGFSFSDGAAAFERLKTKNIDCVLCANDVLAIGFIKAAFDNGLSIPDDIAVIGCDDIAVARYYRPALTTIKFHQYAIGEKAMNMLRDLVAGKETDRFSFNCDLVIRESA